MALTSVAANVVVKLLTTDAWQKAKSGMVALWRRAHPEPSESIERDLTDARRFRIRLPFRNASMPS